jgi:calcineurin-like phosphoesterase family protein
MDQTLICRWNSPLRSNDTVYVLGDFSLAPADQVRDYLNQLAGRKILILGNHDRKPTDSVWAEIHESLLVEAEGHRFYLHHYPVRDWPSKWHGTIHLYGHVHGNLRPLPGSMDVGVDTWGGAPISVIEILRAVEPFNPESETVSESFAVRTW